MVALHYGGICILILTVNTSYVTMILHYKWINHLILTLLTKFTSLPSCKAPSFNHYPSPYFCSQ